MRPLQAAIPSERCDAHERRILELVAAPNGGIGVSLATRLEVLLHGEHRATTAIVVELGSASVAVEAPPGWFTATRVELEVRPRAEPSFTVAGVIRDAAWQRLRIDLLPTRDELAARRLRRFLLEGVRHRVEPPGR